jgi:lipopolysaccharide export system protein LptA
VRLLGPATAELTGPGGGKVTAQQSLDLFLADDDKPQRIDASVGAQAWFTPADGAEPAHLLGDALSVDRAKGVATLTGHARIERGAGPTLRTVSAPSFTASFDQSQQLRSVKASGGVEATAGDLLANADALDWDVPGDLAHLSGHGKLRASGMWMSFTTVELQPNAGRFRIDHVGEVHVER